MPCADCLNKQPVPCPRCQKPSWPLLEGLGIAAAKYMAESMAMREPATDQHQNWICGHMVTFAAAMLRQNHEGAKS